MENRKLRCAVIQPMCGLPSEVIDGHYAETAKMLESLGYEPVFLGSPLGRRKSATNSVVGGIAEMVRTLATCNVAFLSEGCDIDTMTYTLRTIAEYGGMRCFTHHSLTRACGRNDRVRGGCSLPSQDAISKCVEAL